MWNVSVWICAGAGPVTEGTALAGGGDGSVAAMAVVERLRATAKEPASFSLLKFGHFAGWKTGFITIRMILGSVENTYRYAASAIVFSQGPGWTIFCQNYMSKNSSTFRFMWTGLKKE